MRGVNIKTCFSLQCLCLLFYLINTMHVLQTVYGKENRFFVLVLSEIYASVCQSYRTVFRPKLLRKKLAKALAL